MSHKTISNLPDNVGVWATLAQNYNKSNSVQILFEKQRAQAKAFSLLPCSAISRIGFCLEKIGKLIELNNNYCFDVPFLKDMAINTKEELNICFEQILENKSWCWYYKNKESALIQEAYSILNLVINY